MEEVIAMALVRWDPWSEMLSMQRDMQDLIRRTFGDWTGPLAPRGNGMASTAWIPPIDVFGRDGDLVVRAEIPGVNLEKDVEILLEGGALVIRGERRHEDRDSGGTWFRSETAHGSFERRIAVPESTKDTDVTATYENGILEVVVAKAVEQQQPKRIPVMSEPRRRALAGRGRKS